mmetsp:Transcript_77992/g.107815  ORF Transcript_77992/g.107815 Transcript_77992/m.107815 type:complete len:82 (+) Transcript_77992:248-493(+)
MDGDSSGKLDWRDQQDHPMVQNNKSGDGRLDWHDPEDHPMVQDDDESSIMKMYDDFFGDDHALSLSAGCAIVSATVFAVSI